MAEYLIQGDTLDDIADAINAKTGGSSAMTPAQMVTAIGTISGGGVTQGLFDLSFNYTDGRGNTTSGSVSNNTVSNFNAAGYYSPPLLLKQPITINTGDVIEISFENGVNIGGYTDVGLVHSIYYFTSAGAQKLSVVANENFPASGSKSVSITYSGNSAIVNALYYYKRSAITNVSFAIHLKINNVLLF